MDSSNDDSRDWNRPGGVGRRVYGKARVGGRGRGRGGREGRGGPRERPDQTPEQNQAKDDYHSWKRLIKRTPEVGDTITMRTLWTGALAILNGTDRDCKQMLPRDLDDQDNYGRDHMQALLGMVVRGQGFSTFVGLAQPFILVITHPALLDCLSVDTSVGGLYNYFSGSNGSRAIPFFQRLSAALLQQYQASESQGSTVILETTLISMSTALRELLRREQRAMFHDDLLDLVLAMENVVTTTSLDQNSVAFHVVNKNIEELRGMIVRARGLLQHDEESQTEGVSTGMVASTYPRYQIMPSDRHDNDRVDITKIKIIPTEDEIRSDCPTFLPSTDLDQPHFLSDCVERHLDTQFRLLRQDVFGELSDVLGGAIVAVENDSAVLETPKFSLGNVRAYSYPKARVTYISIDQKRGLEAQISFLQPFGARKKSPGERRKWWEASKRLEEGILLCFLFQHDTRCSFLFFTVTQKVTDPRHDHGLSSDTSQATITAKLASPTQTDLDSLIHLSCHNSPGLLMEFPGIILATFLPILESIQDMQRLSRLPFRQWILPDRLSNLEGPSNDQDIPPPLYARGVGFEFSLKPILKDPNGELFVRARIPINSAAIVDELQAQTSLDRGQCYALLAALTREFTFIQGPPGTGKSYLGVQLMQVLLACKAKADLGPIVVVCYTNHALDQFLEHLVRIDIDRVIRIGGQSQSTILEGKNLRVISKGESKTRSEGYQLAMTYKALDEHQKAIKKLLRTLQASKKGCDWALIQRYLLKGHPRIHNQFSRFDEDGFEKVGRDPFDIWCADNGLALFESTKDVANELIEQLLIQATDNVHSLILPQRRRLVAFWTQEIRSETTDRLFELVKDVDTLQNRLTRVHDEVDRRVLQTADVIGVTTTGLARRIVTLQHVRSKVVICEEAGEVMEPHILSALLPSVEHFIQIGDHQQLRPQINNYNLSLESQQGASYQLDRSQFERLSVGERGRPSFPVAQLNVQRRMRPEISTLIRETMYPRLLDHTSTKTLPSVVGMRKDVFWLDHENYEEGARADVHQKSHSNLWEVNMIHALVRHILRQGVYNSTDIAVLTPYTGQLQKIRSKMRNDFEIVLSERDRETLTKDGYIGDDIGSENDGFSS